MRTQTNIQMRTQINIQDEKNSTNIINYRCLMACMSLRNLAVFSSVMGRFFTSRHPRRASSYSRKIGRYAGSFNFSFKRGRGPHTFASRLYSRKYLKRGMLYSRMIATNSGGNSRPDIFLDKKKKSLRSILFGSNIGPVYLDLLDVDLLDFDRLLDTLLELPFE